LEPSTTEPAHQHAIGDDGVITLPGPVKYESALFFVEAPVGYEVAVLDSLGTCFIKNKRAGHCANDYKRDVARRSTAGDFSAFHPSLLVP
jgi:hypothetical protein